jgi:hypothetical protein
MNAPAPRLADLARRVGRLRPDWSNPERYFADRQEIERELHRLAREVARG